MDEHIISSIANIGFAVIIFLLGLVGALSIYILIRYGRTRSITIASSAVFATLFVLQSIAAFAFLQNVLEVYGA